MKHIYVFLTALLFNSCCLFSKTYDETQPIANFHMVNSYLYRSGALTEDNMKLLQNYGVVTILSLDDYSIGSVTAKDEEAWAKAAGFNWIWFPMSGIDAPTVEQLYYALDIIAKVKNLPILVHCRQGRDRTGLVIASYRIKEGNWAVEDAIKELRQYGHNWWLFWWDDVLYDL